MRESPFTGRSTGAEPERDHPLDQRMRRLENRMASEIPIDPIDGLTANTVQGALEEMAAALVAIGAL